MTEFGSDLILVVYVYDTEEIIFQRFDWGVGGWAETELVFFSNGQRRTKNINILHIFMRNSKTVI